MPLEPQSLLKIYRADRIIGNSHPIIVVTADTTLPDLPFHEFYIFHKVPNVEFLYRRTRNSASDDLRPFDFGQFPEVFSATSMLASALSNARDTIEFAILKRDRDVYQELFWTPSAVQYAETDELPLVELRLFGSFVEERTLMCQFTRSKALKQLCRKLATFPELNQQHEP